MKRTRKAKEKAKSNIKRFRELHPDVVLKFNLDQFSNPFIWLENAKKNLEKDEEANRSLVCPSFVYQYRSNFEKMFKSETIIIKNPVLIKKIENSLCGSCQVS